MERLLIVGASGRAAAASLGPATRAVVIDLFADVDTAELATCLRADASRYPESLAELAETVAPTPWLFVGGPENHPDLVARISRRHELLGNGPGALRLVRDRAWLAARVAEAGALMPEALAPDSPTPEIGRWLWKPARAGGLGIRVSPPGEVGGPREAFVEGRAIGAAFVTARGQTRLWGVAESLGGDFAHAKPFHYAGGTAPALLDPAIVEVLHRLGDHVGRAGKLVGAWNLDCILAESRVFVLELNPRLTASIDLFDRVLDARLAPAHVAACRGELPAMPRPNGRFAAKAVYFAPGPITYPGGACAGVAVADRPAPGTRFDAGEPVATLIAAGESADDCLARVRAAAASFDRFGGRP